MKSVTSNIKLFVLDPLWDKMVTTKQVKALKEAGYEIRIDSEPKPIKDVSGLFEGNEPRVLAINPDYLNWTIKNEDYKSIPNLKAILIASTAYDWVEQDTANKKSIPICQIVNFSTQAVAEWAVMIMFSLARHVPNLIKDGFPLDYDKDFMKYRGLQLKGKKVGIIGLGNIGSAIAELCSGIGMDVQYWSHSSTNNKYHKVSLEVLMKTSDVVFPALAKNEETLKLITSDLIKSMKKTAILVDIAHGLFDEKLVLQMIKSEDLLGYGFEGKPNGFEKFEGNVWAAPAYAWATKESMDNSMVLWVENMVNAAQGKFPNRVN